MADRVLTPQQELFLAAYVNPKSDTFGNALRSALKAGYAQEYAENITFLMPEWLLENIGDMRRLRKAEKVLDETLEMPIEIVQIKQDEEGNTIEVVKTEPQLIKIKQDSGKFVAERLGKGKYSTRQELTGPNGQDLFRPNGETKEKIDKLLGEIDG